jgi:hypothetical protein
MPSRCRSGIVTRSKLSDTAQDVQRQLAGWSRGIDAQIDDMERNAPGLQASIMEPRCVTGTSQAVQLGDLEHITPADECQGLFQGKAQRANEYTNRSSQPSVI